MDLVTLRLLAAVSRIAAILPNDLAPTIMNGPKLPFVGRSDAAPQLRQTGHSCIVQHVLGPNDHNADKVLICCASTNDSFQ